MESADEDSGWYGSLYLSPDVAQAALSAKAQAIGNIVKVLCRASH